ALISTFMRVLLVRGTAIETPVRRPARTSRPICSSTCPRSSTSGACRLRNGRGNHTHTPARSPTAPRRPATETRSRAHAFAPIPYDPRQLTDADARFGNLSHARAPGRFATIASVCVIGDHAIFAPGPDSPEDPDLGSPPPRWDPWRTEKPRHQTRFGGMCGGEDPMPTGKPLHGPSFGAILGEG